MIFIALHYIPTDSGRSLLIQNRASVMGTFNLSGLETNRVFFKIFCVRFVNLDELGELNKNQSSMTEG